jgi:hypothetical protein
LTVLLAGLASGCIDSLGQAETRVGEMLGDCVIGPPLGVSTLGAPVSLEYPGHSLWIWDSVTFDDGSVITNVAAEVPGAGAACSGVVLASDGTGAPQSLLPLTEEEQGENAERTDGRRLALVPRGGFTHEGAGYLYYEHTLLGPGIFDSELLGTGLCVIDPGVESLICRRVVVDGTDVLFSPEARPLNQGGLVDGDRALILGCRRASYLSEPCTVTGVPLGAGTPRSSSIRRARSRWALFAGASLRRYSTSSRPASTSPSLIDRPASLGARLPCSMALPPRLSFRAGAASTAACVKVRTTFT